MVRTKVITEIADRDQEIITELTQEKEELEEKEQQLKQEQEELEKAQEMKKQLDEKVVVIKVKTGSNGKLFGSVTNKEVAEEIIKQTGMDLDKKKVSIGDSIKMLGERTAVIKLHPKVTAEVTVKIVEA